MTSYVEPFNFVYSIRKTILAPLWLRYAIKTKSCDVLPFTYSIDEHTKKGDIFGLSYAIKSNDMLTKFVDETNRHTINITDLISLVPTMKDHWTTKAKVLEYSIDDSDQSYCMKLSMTLKDENFLHIFRRLQGNQRKYFGITIDTEPFKFILETVSETKKFGEYAVTITGRTIQCLLDSPYADKYSYTSGQLLGGAISSNRKRPLRSVLESIWALDSDYPGNLTILTLPPNDIYPGQIQFEDMTVMQMLTEICSDLELELFPSPAGNITIQRRKEYVGHPALYRVHKCFEYNATGEINKKDYFVREISREKSVPTRENAVIVYATRKENNDMERVIELSTEDEAGIGDDITIKIYNSSTNKVRISCNVGNWGNEVGAVVLSPQTIIATLENEQQVDEETTSEGRKKFKLKYRVDTAEAMTITCRDNSESYTDYIDYYDLQEGYIYLTKDLPYVESHLRVTYYAKWIGEVTFTCPNFATPDCFIRAWDKASSDVLNIDVEPTTDDTLGIWLQTNSLPADGRHYTWGRVYCTRSPLPGEKTQLTVDIGMLTRRIGTNIGSLWLGNGRTSVYSTSNVLNLDPGGGEIVYPDNSEIEIDQKYKWYKDFLYVTPCWLSNSWKEAAHFEPDEDGEIPDYEATITARFRDLEAKSTVSLTNPAEAYGEVELYLVAEQTTVRRDKNMDIYLVTDAVNLPYTHILTGTAEGNLSGGTPNLSTGGNRLGGAMHTSLSNPEGDDWDVLEAAGVGTDGEDVKVEYDTVEDRIKFVKPESNNKIYRVTKLSFDPGSVGNNTLGSEVATSGLSEEKSVTIAAMFIHSDIVLATATIQITVRPAPGDYGFTCTLTVTDNLTGKPLVGAHGSLYSVDSTWGASSSEAYSAKSDEEGKMVFHCVQEKLYKVKVTKSGYINNLADGDGGNDYIYVKDIEI